jgi:hypothetical protein
MVRKNTHVLMGKTGLMGRRVPFPVPLPMGKVGMMGKVPLLLPLPALPWPALMAPILALIEPRPLEVLLPPGRPPSLPPSLPGRLAQAPEGEEEMVGGYYSWRRAQGLDLASSIHNVAARRIALASWPRV